MVEYARRTVRRAGEGAGRARGGGGESEERADPALWPASRGQDRADQAVLEGAAGALLRGAAPSARTAAPRVPRGCCGSARRRAVRSRATRRLDEGARARRGTGASVAEEETGPRARRVPVDRRERTRGDVLHPAALGSGVAARGARGG